MKKGMRFLAVAALSVAMTTAFGQTGSQGSSGSTGSGSSSGTVQQDKTQSGQGTRQDDPTQSTQSGTTRQGQSGTQSGAQSGTQSGTSPVQPVRVSQASLEPELSQEPTGQSRQGQSGQGSQGMGAGSAEAKVKSEVQWMKSEFNLTDQQEQRLHDVLLKYESQSATGADASKNKEEKEKEIKAIIGEDNFKVYKEKKKDER